MTSAIKFFVLLLTYISLICAERCSPPKTNLGSRSFDESQLAKFASNKGIFETASWEMPKNFFKTDWDPNLVQYRRGVLSLSVEKRDDGKLMGAEIRTKEHFGYGCVSACMKPIKESGIITSLFTYTGKWDGNNGLEAKHNEIDIEFEGKDTTMVQFNYYTNNTLQNQNNEIKYPLGYDAAYSFNVYGFRWTPMGIEWEVNGEIVKSVGRDAVVKPPLATEDGLQKIMANTWIVSSNIEEWFGGPFHAETFTKKNAKYRWIRYEKLDCRGRCSIASRC